MKSFSDFDIQVPTGATGNIKTICPACKHDRKPQNRNKKDLSVDVARGIWNCHNCQYAGSLHEAAEKTYTRPKVISAPPLNKVQAWFKARRITPETLKSFGICEKMEWMPQTEKEENCIAFPYVKHGEVVNYKFRDGAKNFKMVKGAELCIFNYDGVRGKRVVIITEGEIDALSVYQAGICLDQDTGVCSVPNGAAKGNRAQKLEYLDNSWQAFNDAERIIIATDNDAPGQALKAELSRRLGRYRCEDVFYPKSCKDLNEVLITHGAAGVANCLRTSKPMPVEGIIQLSDIEAEIDDFYENGSIDGVTIGYADFDRHYRFATGRVSIWTGVPGSGKSTFLDQVLIRLASRHDWKHGVCSFEKQPITKHFKSLASCYVGKPFHNEDQSIRMTSLELNKAKNFFRYRFFWFKQRDEDLSIDGIISKAIHLVKAHGIQGLVIDPYNYIESKRKSTQTETEYVSEILGKLCTFAKNYDVHVWLIAHPVKKKMSEGEFEVPTLYDIAGSQNFYSKTDNGGAIHRWNKSPGQSTFYIQKIRYEPEEGTRGAVDFYIDALTGRYREDGEPNFTSEMYWAPAAQQGKIFAESTKTTDSTPTPVIQPKLDHDEPLPF
jgi:twinkle protein